MKMRRALVPFIAFVLLAAACAPTGPAASGEASPSGAPSVAAPTAAPSATPVRGGVLNVSLAGNPPHVFLGLSTSFLLYQWLPNVYSYLVRHDPKLGWVPDLAESWQISPDGHVYTFKLRQGVKWHDGEPFGPDDVKFTLEEVLSLGANGATWKAAKVTIAEPQTVRIELTRDYGLALSILGDYQTPIYPKHLLRGKTGSLQALTASDFNKQPIGTGPFKFAEYVPGGHIRLVRNESYFKPGLPRLDGVVYKIIPSPQGRVAALESGGLDFLPRDVELVDADRLKANDKLNVAIAYPILAKFYTIFANERHPALKDVRVRRGIAYAIDRARIVERAQYGLGTVEYNPLMNTKAPHVGQVANPGITQYKTDPAQAKKLLAEAGFPSLKLDMLVETSIAGNLNIATLIQDDLKQVGIELTQTRVDTATAQNRVYIKGEYDLYLVRIVTYAMPVLEMQSRVDSRFIKPAVPLNAVAYANPALDKLFDDGLAIADPAARRDIEFKIQELVSSELPLIPLVGEPEMRVSRRNVREIPPAILGSDVYEATWKAAE